MLHAAVGRVGEVDCAVALDDYVVGAVELLAGEVAGEDGDRAVRLGARQTARGMLARDQAALKIPREAVRLVAGVAKRGDAVLGAPSAQMVAWHIAKQQVAVAPMPQRPFREDAARRQSFELDRRAD